MKRLIILPLLFVCFCLQGQTQVDTLYFDVNGKGVDGRDFARSYLITYTPSNPNFAKRFKWYYVNTNQLFLEGQFLSLNPYDSKTLVVDGTVTWYHPNGNIESERSFSNGKLNGKFAMYDENQAVTAKGNFKDDLLDGTLTTYYANGNVASVANYENGILNGPYAEYANNGNLIEEKFYTKGLPTGKLTRMNADGTVSTQNLIPFIPSDGSFGASINAHRETFCGDRSSSFTTLGGEKVYSVKQSWWLDYPVVGFTLMIYNGTENIMPCSVTDVVVEYIKKDKPSKNKAIADNTISRMCSGHTAIMTTAYNNEARQTAKRASTTQSSSNSGAYSSSNTSASATSSSSASGQSYSYGNYGYSNNTGYRSGGSAYGNSGSYNSQNSAVSVSGNTSNSAQGYSSSTQHDGNLEYQIYQVEKEKADNQIKQVQNTMMRVETEAQISSFSVSPNQTEVKTFYCSGIKSSFDKILVNFKLNGNPYTITFYP